MQELLKSNLCSTVWNKAFIETIELRCEVFCVLGRNMEEKERIRKRIWLNNGLDSDTRVDIAAKILLLDIEFTDNHVEYWDFVRRYLKNEIQVTKYEDKVGVEPEDRFNTMLCANFVSDPSLPLRYLQFKAGPNTSQQILKLGNYLHGVAKSTFYFYNYKLI